MQNSVYGSYFLDKMNHCPETNENGYYRKWKGGTGTRGWGWETLAIPFYIVLTLESCNYFTYSKS